MNGTNWTCDNVSVLSDLLNTLSIFSTRNVLIIYLHRIPILYIYISNINQLVQNPRHREITSSGQHDPALSEDSCNFLQPKAITKKGSLHKHRLIEIKENLIHIKLSITLSTIYNNYLLYMIQEINVAYD